MIRPRSRFASVSGLLALFVSWGLFVAPGCASEPVSKRLQSSARALALEVPAAVDDVVTLGGEVVHRLDDLQGMIPDETRRTFTATTQTTSRILLERLAALSAALGESVKASRDGATVSAERAARLRRAVTFATEFATALRGVYEISVADLQQPDRAAAFAQKWSVAALDERLQADGTTFVTSVGGVIRDTEDSGKAGGATAVVVDGSSDTLAQVLASICLVLGLLALAVMGRRRRRAEAGIHVRAAQAIAGGIALVAAVVVFIAPVRSVLIGTERIALDGASHCPDVLAEAQAIDTADHPGPVLGARRLATVDLMSGLWLCEAEADAPATRDQARLWADDLLSRLGVSKGCARDDQCPADQHCERAVGLCSARCTGDAQCRDGQVCHLRAGGFCDAPCAHDRPCRGGLACGGADRCGPAPAAPDCEGPSCPGGILRPGHDAIDIVLGGGISPCIVATEACASLPNDAPVIPAVGAALKGGTDRYLHLRGRIAHAE